MKRALLLILCVCAWIRADAQVFRSAVDVIDVEVQVTDSSGAIVQDLAAPDFSVTVAGKPHRVLDVRLVNFSLAAGKPLSGDPAAQPKPPADASTPSRQVFVVALDALTFPASVSFGVSKAAAEFVTSLPPGALVGLYSFPLGPRLDPTANHGSVVAALRQFSGQRPAQQGGQFNLRNSELIDYTEGADASAIVRARCGPLDRICRQTLDTEVWNTVQQLEAQAQASLGMLRDLVGRLGQISGRKILVLVSEGVTMSDRPGGRPDVADLPVEIGEAAARSNTMIYCLYIDHTVLERYSAEQGRATKRFDHLERDSDVAMRGLDLIAGAAGGSLMKVLVGEGGSAYQRIVRETSGVYSLQVEAKPEDMTGHFAQIRVKVNRPRVVVRSREWVVLPKAGPS